MKRILIIISSIIILIILITIMILNQPTFGQNPKENRLERIKKSPNYKNGEFVNLSETSVMNSDKSRFRVMLDFMFGKKERLKPSTELPVVKTDIKSLNPQEDILIWFGHSSYYIQLNGKKFLIDPVFSSYASPFSFINKAFKLSHNYSAADFDDIDYLIITHDHYDHLDYNTVKDLQPKVKHVVCGLGVGQHFESWDYDNSIITELDWYEEMNIENGWSLTATPARHFSGRGLKGNQTLWVSYVLKTPELNLYLSGDGGYDTHFAQIGEKYGPFDLAVFELGQYNEDWNLIHMMPDMIFKAAKDVKAKKILPVHHSKFALAKHPWDEPLKKITATNNDIPVATPQIGEQILLKDSTQTFTQWWKEIN